ncbi:hypothetical protein PAAG_04314 [Paracoccidioides lutzii Pb01]|uniref:GST N-terminal domain-containing protein n=1 Tax=Paracoccidioides lutzii (strain ATCC MYA-826 / Pb01) TaxID=502779 RepID=C1H0M0_PARBA|nr:hypothetical protein PAAG_04314 [Paracoccidioides lutzii Pb01]EEH33261.2 hypothetical protein PAAG_04314 [Paracoccidioides lutzii Pb01]
MTNPKFWYSPSSCSLAPHILLRELGLEAETIQITDFVPRSLWLDQSQAPCPRPLCRPRNHNGAYEWMNWLTSQLNAGLFGMLFGPARFTDDLDGVDGIKMSATQRVQDEEGTR